MNAWARCLLSTTFTVKALGTPEQRVRHALQQREILRNAANRTSRFQRCHEVARARQLLAETTSAEVTSQMAYDAHQKNFTTFPHLAGTLSFYNLINIVLQKMLGVSDVHAVLHEADSQGFSVFGSHSRLRVILNKTGTNAEHRVWVVEGLFHMAENAPIRQKRQQGRPQG